MTRPRIPARPASRGLALIVVLQLLLAISILGLASAQLALMGERGARNARDMQLALQAAEAGLADAIRDVDGPADAVARAGAFDDPRGDAFVEGCGTGPRNHGLCRQRRLGKPVWQEIDFTDATRTAGFGEFTGRTFASGTGIARGLRPALAPRYIVEAIEDRELLGDLSLPSLPVYRITAMGFGPRRDIQVVLQTLYRRRRA